MFLTQFSPLLVYWTIINFNQIINTFNRFLIEYQNNFPIILPIILYILVIPIAHILTINEKKKLEKEGKNLEFIEENHKNLFCAYAIFYLGLFMIVLVIINYIQLFLPSQGNTLTFFSNEDLLPISALGISVMAIGGNILTNIKDTIESKELWMKVKNSKLEKKLDAIMKKFDIQIED